MKRYSVKIKTIQIFSNSTVDQLNNVQRNIGQWVARLPEKDIGLTFGDSMVRYAKGTVNEALNEIADSHDKEAKNIPAVTGIAINTKLNALPSSGVTVRIEVSRGNKSKSYTTTFSFTDPAAGAKALFQIVKKDLGGTL